MKAFSISMISLFAMVGVAAAQPAKPAEPKTTTAAGANAKAGASAGAANSGAAGATVQAGAGAKMEMPKPPAELSAMIKQMAGTWKCTGTAMGMDMKEAALKGTMKIKGDLDGWWARHVFDASMTGADKKVTKFKMESFATYDAPTKKWRSVAMMNDGGLMVSTSDGMKDGKMSSTADTWGPMGQSQFRETMDQSDMKAGVKMAGEMTMDKGKNWMKVYEMTCKK